jgi:ribonuclease P protein component
MPGQAFPKKLHVRTRREFSAVFEPHVRISRGPLLLYGVPNRLDHCRLGLSTPRRVGLAVVRNRIRRLLRESFRLLQHELPPGYDLIVVVRPHEPMALAEYQRLLRGLCIALDAVWRKKARSDSPG